MGLVSGNETEKSLAKIHRLLMLARVEDLSFVNLR